MIALALLLFSSTLFSGIYRWTDADGKVHYGDRPADNAVPLRLNTSPAPTKPSRPAGIDRKQAQQRLLDLYQEEREEKKKLRREQKAERKARKRKCLEAKAELDKYQYARAIYRSTEGGEREYLPEAERTDYIQQLNGKVKKWCGLKEPLNKS